MVHGFGREFHKGFVPHVRRRSLIRTRSRARGGISQSLQPDEGLHLLIAPLHICGGGVPIRQRAPVHKFFGIVATMDWSVTNPLHCGNPHSVQSLSTSRQIVACTDYVAPSFVMHCAPHAAKIPNYGTTSDRSCVSSIHASSETLTRVKNLAVLPACSKPMLAESHSSVDSVCSVDFAQTRE